MQLRTTTESTLAHGAAMDRLHRIVRGSPPPLVLPDAGQLAQESGDVIARAALAAFGPSPQQ